MKIKTDDLILYGALALGTIYLFPKIKALLFPTTPEQTAEKFLAMGYNSYVAKLEPGAAYVKAGDALYRFTKGDYDRLNFAQKLLLSTHIVPTKWILG